MSAGPSVRAWVRGRVGTAMGAPGARLVGAAMMVLALALVVAACGGPETRSSRLPSDYAVVVVQCNVPEAELWVDERFVGLVGTLAGGVALAPGTHRLELRHGLYHAHYAELTVGRRERTSLEVVLVPVLR